MSVPATPQAFGNPQQWRVVQLILSRPGPLCAIGPSPIRDTLQHGVIRCVNQDALDLVRSLEGRSKSRIIAPEAPDLGASSFALPE